MRGKKTCVKVLALVTILGLLCVTGAIAAEETITGTVAKNDAGSIIISADNGESFMVKGQDLSSMVGKSVQVTGTLEEDSSGKSIMVTAVEQIKE
jgi:hypothetical protein